MKLRALLVLFTITLVACSPVEQQARDTAAALQGALTAAQTQYQATCTSNPQQRPCVTINQAVAGQNALITAVEAYCGWNPVTPPPNPTSSCVPVKTAQAGLQTAINNANLFIAELRQIIQSTPAKS